MMNAHFVVQACVALVAVGLFSIGVDTELGYRCARHSGLTQFSKRGPRGGYSAVPPFKIFRRSLPGQTLGPKVFRAVALLGTVAAVWLLFSAVLGASLRWPLGVSIIFRVALTVRAPLGLSQADKLLTVILLTLGLVELLPSKMGEPFALSFICGQSLLAYFSAGVFKCREQRWRDGSFLREVLSTEAYSTPALAQFLRASPAVCRPFATILILGEITFPLVLVASRPLMLAILAAGLLFHVCVATIMGLRTFLWAFLSTYPAIMYCNAMVWRYHK
jgi:hypothetical protein